MVRYFLAVRLCLLTAFLNCPVHGVTLNGIDVKKMLERFSETANSESPAQQTSDVGEHVDVVKALGNTRSPETTTDNVAISFLNVEEKIDFMNTDDEESDAKNKIQKIEGKKPGKKFAAIGNKNKEACLLAKKDWQQNEEKPEEDVQKLCKKLALDAYEIANISGEGKNTTCLCVLLKDTEGYVHKIVFHNTKGQLAPAMRTRASCLGYTARNARKGHAEAQFVSFLYTRACQESPPMQYTHIMGMGCSRKNCPHCASLLKFFLGKDYAVFHAYALESDKTKEEIRMEKKVIDGETRIQKTIPEQTIEIEAVHPGADTGFNPRNNYLLPENIQSVITQQTQALNSRPGS